MPLTLTLTHAHSHTHAPTPTYPHTPTSPYTQAAHHHDDMLWYIIFLRITPFLPNWFINLASPIIGVRVLPFYWGTFFGTYSINTLTCKCVCAYE